MYNLYDIRVPLGNGEKAISMNVGVIDHQQTYCVIFADPRKLAPVIHKMNKKCSFLGWVDKTKTAWINLRLARIDKKPNDRVPINPDLQNSVPIGHIAIYKDRGVTTCSFIDGTTRSTELVRQQAQFIPLLVFTEAADSAHKLLGSRTPPVPASSFLVSESERLRLMLNTSGKTYSKENRRADRRYEAARRLCNWYFKKLPLSESDFELQETTKPYDFPSPRTPLAKRFVGLLFSWRNIKP